MKPEISFCSVILPVISSLVFTMDESKFTMNDHEVSNTTLFPVRMNDTVGYEDNRTLTSPTDTTYSDPAITTNSKRTNTTHFEQTTVKYSNIDTIVKEKVDPLSRKLTLGDEKDRAFSATAFGNSSVQQNVSHREDSDGYSAVEWNTTEITTVSFSTTPNPICEVEVCSRHPRRKFPKQSGDNPSVFHSISYSSPTYVTELLDLAPCPPPWNVSMLCSVSNNKLSCSDRTHILNKCLKNTPSKSHCGELLKCSKCLGCDEFRLLLEAFKHCSIKFLPQITTPPIVTISGGYLVKTTNHSDFDVAPEHDVLQGDASILVIVVAVFGFLFVPFIVYLLLNRNNRRAVASCFRRFCCTTCKCCKRKHRRNRGNHVEETEIEPIATIPVNVAKGDSPTISRDSTSDSGIGLSMDYDFIDENIPLEYQMASRR